MRTRWLPLVAVTLVLCAGCGHPGWYQSGESACGPTYMLRLHGHVGSYGGCAGVLVEPPSVLRLRTGDHFDLHVDMSPPVLSTVGVLRRTALDHNADRGYATLSFDAVKPGSTDLVEHTYCTIRRTQRQRTGTCALLRVVVTPP